MDLVAIKAWLVATLVVVVLCVEVARWAGEARESARARSAELLAMLASFGLETGYVSSIAEGRLSGRWVRLWKEWGGEVSPDRYLIDVDGITRVAIDRGGLSDCDAFRAALQRLRDEFEQGAPVEARPAR